MSASPNEPSPDQVDPPSSDDEEDNNNNSPDATRPTEPRAHVQMPLGWTQLGQQQQAQQAPTLRYPHDVMEIPEDETELVVVGTAGQKITHLGPDFSQTLNAAAFTKLVLRSHLIQKMEGLEGFTNLELLELYDNQVDGLACLMPDQAPARTLTVLDMSYNAIRDMQPVASCPNLTELYLANNKLKTLAGLKSLVQLRKIDLGANKIRVMDPDELEGLVNLEELWIGKNKIEQIQGLEKLPKLRRLDVQSNRLTAVSLPPNVCATLEELYLAHNAITVEGLEQGLATQSVPNLIVLDLCRNRLTTTAPFAHLTALEELWLSGNLIASMQDVQPVGHLPLDTIYLEYNPLQQKDPLYRKNVAATIPSLKQIDANPIAAQSWSTTAPTAASTPAATTAVDARKLQEAVVERAKAESAQQQQP